MYLRDSKVEFEKKEEEFKKWKISVEEFYKALIQIVPAKSKKDWKNFFCVKYIPK